jgi:hypothetical protein
MATMLVTPEMLALKIAKLLTTDKTSTTGISDGRIMEELKKQDYYVSPNEVHDAIAILLASGILSFTGMEGGELRVSRRII